VGGMEVTLAAVLAIAACVYYLVLDVAFGVTMAVALFGACAAASEAIARLGASGALAAALALFVAGWALQFLGHRYEGMKPAFYDDAKQLLIGPLCQFGLTALEQGQARLRGLKPARDDVHAFPNQIGFAPAFRLGGALQSSLLALGQIDRRPLHAIHDTICSFDRGPESHRSK